MGTVSYTHLDVYKRQELFQNRLFDDMAAHSNRMASILRDGISRLGYSFYSNSMTNQLFPIFSDTLIGKLSENYLFSIQEREMCIRDRYKPVFHSNPSPNIWC